MSKQDQITPEALYRLLTYDAATGRLYWRERTPEMFTDGAYSATRECARWNGRYSGKEAFTHCDANGYMIGAIHKESFKAHRVIWALVHGRWPNELIDHIDRDKSNNRIANLREATKSQNNQNISSHRDGTSRFLGVCWHGAVGKWVAQITIQGRKKHLGCFLEETAAAAAYAKAARKHHGKFAGDISA